jgi:hypothetical protein
VHTVFGLHSPSSTFSPHPLPTGTNPSRQDLLCPPVLYLLKRFSLSNTFVQIQLSTCISIFRHSFSFIYISFPSILLLVFKAIPPLTINVI